MKKIICLMSACLLFVLLLLSCSNNKKQEPDTGKTQDEHSSKITANHVLLLYSDLYIISPTGFSTDSLSGLLQKYEENGKSASFTQVNTFSGSGAEKFIGQMKTEAEKNYPGSWKEESLTVNGEPAMIYHYQLAPGLKTHTLYFAGKSKGLLLIANYEEGDESTGQQMYEALKTTVVKPK